LESREAEGISAGTTIDPSNGRLVLAAFVLGVHIRDDIDKREITAHSPSEIVVEANTKLSR
jgi:hypothetical protein